MSEENVPKPSVEEAIEKSFDALTSGEQQAESTPPSEQTETPQEGGSDPLKTQSTETPGQPNKEQKLGPVPYEKFSELARQNKEARESLKAKEAQLENYSKLLDDPEVYAKWLKSQGYSDSHIRQAMLEKGYQLPGQGRQDTIPAPSNQAQAIAERACVKLGWDINRLSPEQKAYINDSVSLTMQIIGETVGPMMDARFGPIEQMAQDLNNHKQFNQDDMEVRGLAAEEFPGVGWDDVIQPAIQKYLNDLDEKDPKRTIKLTYEDIYYRATRPLLKELTESKGRQEVRDKNKQNLRPLGTGTASRTGEPVQKGRSAREEAEAFLDARGIR